MKNLNIKKNSRHPVFILFLLIFIIIVLYLTYNIGLNFKPETVIQYSGYAISGKDLAQNLLRTDLNAEPYIDAIKIDEDTAVYKKIATYFVGEEKKTKINLDYPIYINQNIALLNMSENSKLITTQFEETNGYKNSTLTDGGLYNLQNMQRADYNDYIFLKNSDNVFINSKELKVKTNTNTYTIPKNSIINFTEEYIAYYYLENGTFKYKSIVDIDLYSIVTLEELAYNRNVQKNEMDITTNVKDYSYKELLTNLNLIKQPNTKKVEKVESKEKDTEMQQKDIVEENDNIDKSNTNDDSQKPKWVKPVVSSNNLTAGVYTASTNLSIYDPSGVLKTAINFEIYKNGKIYMRNQTISSGNIRIGVLEPNTEYEIKGTYRYLNEEEKTIEVEFINQKLKTKDINELEFLKLSFEQKNIYSDKIEFANFMISSNSDQYNEALIGIKSGEIIINDKVQELKSSDLKKLINGQLITYQSENNLKSNSEIEFQIKFYDVANNLVKLENNSGKTRTCKSKPEITVKQVGKKVGIDISFEVNTKNTDNVKIENMNYIVYSIYNEVIDKGAVKENIIKLNNLELAKYYTIKIYGDYDLEDNNGKLIQQLLTETTFATSKIDDFGELYIDLTNNTEDLTESSNIINFNLNTTINKTNLELVKMLKDVKVIVYTNNDIVQEIYLNEEELNSLINLENVSCKIDKLNSNTSYIIKIEGRVRIGSTEKKLSAIINGPKNFTTLKEEAKIDIKNLFILKDTIDFDINVYDKDNAIRTTKLILEVISTRDEVVQRNEISISNNSENYERIQILNLSQNEKYYLSLTTDKYSTRHEESTIKPKSFKFSGNENRISSEKRNEKEVGIIWTNSVGGKILLESLEKRALESNKNLVDVASNVNWYSECFNTTKGYLKEYNKENGILKLGVGDTTTTTSSQIYVYDIKTALTTYNKEQLDISFKFKKSDSNLKVYLQKGTNFSTDKIDEITTEDSGIEENGWFTFNSKDMQTNITTNQYIGLLLEGKPNTYLEIKELQVKLKENEENVDTEIEQQENTNSYNEFKSEFISKFNLNLNLCDDKLEDLGYEKNITNGNYYIRIKNITDNNVNDISYSNYMEIANNDNGINENSIEDSIINLGLEQNKKYEIMLLLKHPNINDREYILNTIEVDTNSNEIKNISCIDDYLKIQPNGSYIFSNDINLEDGDYKFGNEKLYFNGIIDFNGKKLGRTIKLKDDINYKYYLFYGISEKSIIKNLYFNFNINLKNAEGRTDVAISNDNSGLVYENRGYISNIIVNLASSTNSPNQKFAIIGHDNLGTLKNFAIYLKANFYLAGNGALAFVNCNGGTIKNGYLSSYPNTSYTIKPINCSGNEVNIAALSAVTTNSTIDSVYSLITVNNEDESMNNDITKFNTGNLLARVEKSTIKNVYSADIGNITLKYSNNGMIGPTISYEYNIDDKNNIKNSYFFYDENLNNNEYNTKVNTVALSNEEFQNNLLNSDESDKKFIINSTIKEYFPQISMPNVMPTQLKIPMKKTVETEADILLVKTLEDGDTEKLVEFTIYNPKESKIDKIEIDGLEVDKYRIHSDEYCDQTNPFEKCEGHDEEGYCLDKDGNRILVEEDGYTQNYIAGQTTKVITKIRIPKEEKLDLNGYDARQYASEYSLKSIKAKGYNKKVYIEDDGTVKIRNNIKLNYYYQISNIEQWKRINKYPNENYRIIKDLDFENVVYNEYCITNPFTGIIDGKNKENKIATINNVGKEGVETKLPLFYKINNGKVCNISINGFYQIIEQKNVNEDSFLVGLISTTTKGTIINNINIKDAKIITKINKNNLDNFYIGGMIAKAEGTMVSNCSVVYKKYSDDNFNIYDFDGNKLSKAQIGGLIGYSKQSEISNCFTKNISVNVNLGTSNGIGGIVGDFTGAVKNCYSIGKIKTNAQNIGGIFGQTTKVENWIDDSLVNDGNVCSNCYACVNIRTDSTNLGGIGGFITTSVLNELKNNISIGNLYTSMSSSNINLNRMYGNVSSTSHISYAYKNQLINGFRISPQDSNYKRGTQFIVAKEELLKNYNTMFNSDVYFIDDLKSEYLPRLKYNNSNELLPNQEQMQKLPENPVLEISSVKEENGKIRVDIKDENTPQVETNTINVELLNFTNINISNRQYNEQTKTHTLYISGNPIYYSDSYELSKIIYKDNNNLEYSSEISVKVDYLQYKTINSVEDFVKEFCPEYSNYNYHKNENDGKPEYISGQNYKLTNNINLSEIENFNGENVKIPIRLEIGRLVGNNSNDEENRATIYNLNITGSGANFGLFSLISKELKNINFSDIYIKNKVGHYTGIITKCTAQQIENLSFNNIKLESSGSGAYVGAISDSTCTNINNIELENVTCIGYRYVAGFIAHTYPGNITNISGNNINITAVGSYIGGIFGYMESFFSSYGNNIKNITVTNSNIKSTQGANVGGIIGIGSILSNARSENNVIEAGINHVGGIIGYNRYMPGYITDFYVKDITIKTTFTSGSNIGGAFGYNNNSLNNIYVYGVNITTAAKTNVGGICGYGRTKGY